MLERNLTERNIRKKKNEIKSDELDNCPATTYQKYVDEVRKAVEDIRKDENPLSNEQFSASFTELDLDSLSITDLANRLNTTYFPNLQISTVDLFNYPNIFLLMNAIYNRKISSRIIGDKEENILILSLVRVKPFAEDSISRTLVINNG